MRMNLKLFRIALGLTQAQMAEELDYSRWQYAQIELGRYDGRLVFWERLKSRYNLSDSKLHDLMKKDEK